MIQELTVVKAELASAKAEGSKHKQRCDDLQSQNATMTSDLKHSQQSLSSTQVRAFSLLPTRMMTRKLAGTPLGSPVYYLASH